MPWDSESGINIIIPGQGSHEILKKTGNTVAPSDGRSYPLVTSDNWQIGCLPSVKNGAGEGFFAVSPDGVKYSFDWIAKRRQRPVAKDGAILERSNIFLMATSVTDRFGNWVSYTYNPANPLQLQRIDSSDGRSIVLGYNGPYATSATDGSRTWQYGYSDFSVRGELRSIQLPDNSRWTFDLSRMAYMDGDQVFDYYADCDSLPQAASGDFLGTMTHPSGANGTFTTQFRQIGRTNVTRFCTYYPWGGYLAWTNGSIYPKSMVSQALVSKVITGVGLSPLTWQYADYSSPWGEWAPCIDCADSKVVTVTDPLGWFYDPLGRQVAQREDSEIGPLDTVTEYIAGFQRRVTNPRGYATTSAFQAFDEPIEEHPVAIWAPEGVSVSIPRDNFGKALSITRAGNGKSLTRNYFYDGYQRLCKTLEPESAATVQAYDGLSDNIAWRA